MVWPRTVEAMLALWLLMTPFVFDIPANATAWWAVAFIASALILACSLASFWHRTRRLHLGTLAVALALAIYGYIAGGHPSPPMTQSFLLTGLLTAMMAIIPSPSEKPPEAWMRFYAEARDR